MTQAERELAKLIAAGEADRGFARTVLLGKQGDQYRLRADRLRQQVEAIYSIREDALKSIEDQLAHPAIKANPAAGIAQDLKPSFPFGILSSPLKYCKDVKANVTGYSKLFITWSTGHSGADYWYTKQQLHPAVYESNRQSLEADLRAVDPRQLALDRSVLQAIARTPLLLEQIQRDPYLVTACISQLDVTDLFQEPDRQFGDKTILSLDLALRISLRMPTDRGSVEEVPVQELAGSFTSAFRWGAVFYDTKPRLSAIFGTAWTKLVGHFDTVLKRETTSDVTVEYTQTGWFGLTKNTRKATYNYPDIAQFDENLNAAAKQLKRYLTAEQDAIAKRATENLTLRNEDLRKTIANLRDLSRIGLDPATEGVGSWYRILETDGFNADLFSVVNDAVMKGVPIDLLRRAIEEQHKTLNDQIVSLAQSTTLDPGFDHFGPRILQLNQLKEARASQ